MEAIAGTARPTYAVQERETGMTGAGQRDGKEAPFERQFRVLETVAAFPRGLSLTELVTITDLPKTTVHRLLQGLTQSGVLTALNERYGPYVLGPRFLTLLQTSVPDDWTERLAKPLLRELAERTGDTCFLARLSGLSIRSVAMATPENDVHLYVVPGRELSPRHAASAKAILAHQDEAMIASVLAAAQGKPLSVPANLQTFRRELAEVRTQNVAFNAGEDIPGFAAVAAPVHLAARGVQFSVAVTGTFEKLMKPDHRASLISLTQHFARRIGEAIEIRLSQS